MVIKLKEFEVTKIADGIDVVNAPANRFKVNELAISFCLPLKAETASRNALLGFMLSHTTKQYPTLKEFNKKLAMLYGAGVVCSVSKLGENQCITLVVSSLDDKFAIENEKISRESFELLLSLVFNPNVDENGDFYQEDIDREKRLLIEKLESEQNEKRIYSLRQLEKNMFKNEPFAVNRYGTVDDIKSVTNGDLKYALAEMKANAKIQIATVGTADKDEIVEIVKNSFSSVERSYCPLKPAVFVPKADEVNTITERIAVKQGKLLLGFRVNSQDDFSANSSMRAFCDLFGGGPYSKLFANVREKLSLCYYCSARYDRKKSNIIIQCGCEEENMDKAVAEILVQLETIQNGDFDEEFAASKIGLSDVINGVNDDSALLLSWYSNQITDNEILSPNDSASQNKAVTKEDIIRCSKLLSLDTIYKLVSNGEAE